MMLQKRFKIGYQKIKMLKVKENKMKKDFNEYVLEQTLAEKELSGGKFNIEDGESVSLTYTKGNSNMLQLWETDAETISFALKVDNKEVVMRDLPKEKFILKMREFLSKIK